MSIDVRFLQSSKACLPIDVTLLGMVMDVRFEQPQKAPAPIDVTLLGITIDVRFLQSPKASIPIDVTLLGITSDVILPPLQCSFSNFSRSAAKVPSAGGAPSNLI
jgi:hypothetical protein